MMPLEISSNYTEPIDDEFTSYNKSRAKKIYGDEGWPGYLADAFYSHARNRDDSVLDGSKRGRLFHLGHRLDVASGREYSSGRSSHRVVFAVMDIKTQEYQPSVGELILLVSWMLAGMQYQESVKMRRRHKKDKAVRLHMVFPTLVYCFMRPARARVLYGYFENNTLKVVTTKAHDFNVSNYAEMMDYLVRWDSPSIHGNTEMGESLALIEEDDESESIEQV